MTTKKIIRQKIKAEAGETIRHTVRPEFYQSVAEILHSARTKVYCAVNFTMVEAYWNVGRMIVEEEQQGKKRAGYGEALMRNLSERLTLDFGKGFNVSNLWAFKQFYIAFPILRTVCRESPETHLLRQQPAIPSALRRELTWSHYRLLMRVRNRGQILRAQGEQIVVCLQV